MELADRVLSETPLRSRQTDRIFPRHRTELPTLHRRPLPHLPESVYPVCLSPYLGSLLRVRRQDETPHLGRDYGNPAQLLLGKPDVQVAGIGRRGDLGQSEQQSEDHNGEDRRSQSPPLLPA